MTVTVLVLSMDVGCSPVRFCLDASALLYLDMYIASDALQLDCELQCFFTLKDSVSLYQIFILVASADKISLSQLLAWVIG